MSLKWILGHGGECLTLLACTAIVVYLFHALYDTRTLLNHEEVARERIRAIVLLEEEIHGDEGEFVSLARLKEHSPLLAPLRELPYENGEGKEYFTDGPYMYFFLLRHERRSARDTLEGFQSKAPIGYRVIAWPMTFAVSGELAFYADQRGYLLYSTNDCAYYEGPDGAPTEWKEVDLAVQYAMTNEERLYDVWMLHSKIEER